MEAFYSFIKQVNCQSNAVGISDITDSFLVCSQGLLVMTAYRILHQYLFEMILENLLIFDGYNNCCYYSYVEI